METQKKILFITPSYYPTYCGIGNFVYKINQILVKQGFKVFILTNFNQKLAKEQEVDVEKLKNISKIDIKITNLFEIIREIKLYKPEIVNFQYNSAEAGRKLFLSFLPFLLKIFYPKIYIQVTIHEFANYTLLGKIRHTLPTIIADKVFFSDQKQLNSWKNFTKSYFIKKALIFPIGSNILIKPDNNILDLHKWKNKLMICFHGLIQPKNGLEILLRALKELDKEKYELHILGEFKLLIDYGVKTDEVAVYQKNLLDFIKKNDLPLFIHGDIDPSDKKFKEVLNICNVFVCSDIDGITSRRTSFWNVFLQSSLLTISSFDEGNSEAYFKEYLEVVKPNDVNSLKDRLEEILNFSNKDILDKLKKQSLLKEKFQPESYSKEVIKLITNEKST